MVSNNTDSVVRFNGTTGTFIDVFVAPGSGGMDQPKQIFFTPEPSSFVLLCIAAGSFAILKLSKRRTAGTNSRSR